MSNGGLDALLSVAKGSGLGFAAYLIPFGLLRGGRVNKTLLRSAVAFGVFTGGYRAIRIILKKLTHTEKRSFIPPQYVEPLQKWSPAIAAALSSYLGCKVDPSFSSSFFVIWLFFRAVRTLDWAPSHPWLAPAIFVGAVEVIVPAGFNDPTEMHSSYQQFLESFGCGVDLNKMRNPGPGRAIGDAVHSFPSDSQFILRHLIPSLLLKSCKTYWPLHSAAALWKYATMSRRDDKNNTNTKDGESTTSQARHLILSRLCEDIVRSTSFLAGWVGLMWTLVLAHSRYLLQHHNNGVVLRRHTSIWAWLGGFFVLLERPSRQVELATYCAAHAVNSLNNRYQHKLMGPKRATALLTIAAALLVQSWTKQPNAAVRAVLGTEETY